MPPPSYTRPTSEQRECPLFTLPPELRNMIYTYAISQRKPNGQPNFGLPHEHDDLALPVISVDDLAAVKPSNALLSTCQLLSNEASGVFVATQRAFWSSNAFLFELRDDWNEAEEDAEHASPQDPVGLRDEQINAMPKFLVAMSRGGELHVLNRGKELDVLHFTEDANSADPLQSLGWLLSARFHSPPLPGALSAAWQLELSMAMLVGRLTTLTRISANRLRVALASLRIADHGESARAYMSNASRGRELSRTEKHAMLKWEEKKTKALEDLDSLEVNTKREVLASTLRYFCEHYELSRRPRV